MNKKGCLYGIGVGPGDAENITLKAVRRIKECKYIAVPGEIKEESAAYKIVTEVFHEQPDVLAQKHWLALSMPMTKDMKKWKECHKNAAEQLADILEKGEDVAFLTLGDPTIYSTYLYVHELISQRGYEAVILSGIPSFCAVAARAGQALASKKEQMHIIPGNYGFEEALALSGTKVFMKIGSSLDKLKALLKSKEYAASYKEIFMVENCGMENERCYAGIDEIPNQAGYFSIVVVK